MRARAGSSARRRRGSQYLLARRRCPDRAGRSWRRKGHWSGSNRGIGRRWLRAAQGRAPTASGRHCNRQRIGRALPTTRTCADPQQQWAATLRAGSADRRMRARLRHRSDHEQLIEEVAARALADSDLVIFPAEYRWAAYDFIPQVLLRIGVEVLFHGVNMQPGSPPCLAAGAKPFVAASPQPGCNAGGFRTATTSAASANDGSGHRTKAWCQQSWRRTSRARKASAKLRFRFASMRTRRSSDRIPRGRHISAISQADALLVVPAGTKDSRSRFQVHVRPL